MFEYKLKVTRVVDGDTVDGLIDLGFNTFVKKILISVIFFTHFSIVFNFDGKL